MVNSVSEHKNGYLKTVGERGEGRLETETGRRKMCN